MTRRKATIRCDNSLARSASVNLGSVRISLTVTGSPRLYASSSAPEGRYGPPAADWSDPIVVRRGDDEVVAVDHGIGDAVHAEVFAEEAYGQVLNLDRIAQRAECIIEPEDEASRSSRWCSASSSRSCSVMS